MTPRLMPQLAPKSSALTMRYFMMKSTAASSQRIETSRPRRLVIQRTVQNFPYDLLGVKIRHRQFPCGAAMPFVVAVDGLESADCLFRRRKTKHAFAVGQELAWPRVLHYNRLSAGQITHRAITYPRVLKLHTRTLRAAKLATRLLDIGPIQLRRGRDLARVADAPAALFHLLPLFQVPLPFQEQSQLEGLGGQLRQMRIVQKRDSLGVLIFLVAVHNPIGRIPDRNCGERFRARVEPKGPVRQAKGGTNGNPVQTTIGNPAAAFAHVLTYREIQIMPGHGQLPAAHPELQKPGVDIN